MKASGYLAPWTGCEREIMPEKYAESVLLTEKEIMDVLEKLYLEIVHKKEMERNGIQEAHSEDTESNAGSQGL